MNHTDGNNGNSHGDNGNGKLQLPTGVGGELGDHGVGQLIDRAGSYCSCERQRIEAENGPKIAAAREELVQVERELDHVRDEVAKLPPEGDLRSRRRRALFEWVLAGVLVVAGFGFSLAALEPFQLGWKGLIYSLGLALIVPYSIDMVLQHWGHRQSFLRTLAILTALLAILAMVSLALIRTHLFAEQLQQAKPVVVIEGEGQPPEPQPVNTFYKKTQLLLSIFMVLAALGMEINAGVAVYNARRLGAEIPANADELRHRFKELERQKVSVVHNIKALEQEPQAFVNRFWGDFHKALVKGGVHSTTVKMWTFLLFAVFLFCGRSVFAREPVNLVVAVDLSASVATASGVDNKTEMEKDLAAVSRLLASAPAGSRITVIGVNDRSFSEPYVLLSAQLDANEGYFHERIANARHELLRAWQKRCATLVSRSQQTDLLGALIVASQLFHSQTGRTNMLVILSDMRHDTRSLNLARFPQVPAGATLRRIQAAHLVADLKGVEVYALGVDGAGKTVAYWDSLRNFWTAYFREAGADLRAYSILREVPELAR